jgi:hypothetical protein
LLDGVLVYAEAISGFSNTTTWQHVFQSYGYNQEVTVRAYDAQGLSDYVEWDVDVVAGPTLDCTPSNLSVVTFPRTGKYTFTVHAVDEDENLENIQWRLDGALVDDRNTSVAREATRSYEAALSTRGTHVIEVQVSDTDDNLAVATWTVYVGEEKPSLQATRVAPVEQVCSVPEGQTTFGLEITASSSLLSKVEWYLDGDLIQSYALSGRSATCAAYISVVGADRHSITAIAVDDGGGWTTMTWLVTATASEEPAFDPTVPEDESAPGTARPGYAANGYCFYNRALFDFLCVYGRIPCTASQRVIASIRYIVLLENPWETALGLLPGILPIGPTYRIDESIWDDPNWGCDCCPRYPKEAIGEDESYRNVRPGQFPLGETI